MNNIVKIIKQETGLSIHEFCKKELNTKYTAFNLRMKRNKLYLAEIFYIVYRTRKSIVDLFGENWYDHVINTQGGPISDKVKAISEKMSPEERSQIYQLMFGNHLQAPETGKPELAKEIITKGEVLPEPVNKLKGMVVNIYQND